MSSSSLPCLENLFEFVVPDTGTNYKSLKLKLDTNYLAYLIDKPEVRVSITIELVKSLHAKLEANDLQFRSPKQIDWMMEILGHGLIPPQYAYYREEKNYVKNILNIYECILCDEVHIEKENKTYRYSSNRVS